MTNRLIFDIINLHFGVWRSKIMSFYMFFWLWLLCYEPVVYNIDIAEAIENGQGWEYPYD